MKATHNNLGEFYNLNLFFIYFNFFILLQIALFKSSVRNDLVFHLYAAYPLLLETCVCCSDATHNSRIPYVYAPLG